MSEHAKASLTLFYHTMLAQCSQQARQMRKAVNKLAQTPMEYVTRRVVFFAHAKCGRFGQGQARPAPGDKCCHQEGRRRAQTGQEEGAGTAPRRRPLCFGWELQVPKGAKVKTVDRRPLFPRICTASHA